MGAAFSWRSVHDSPGWQEGGACELRRADGSIVAAWVQLDEAVDSEGNDYPVVEYVELKDGTRVSFFDFSEFRKVAR